MIDAKMRYVTVRRNRNGTPRYYWQRSGHPLTRLPDHPTDRFNRQAELNEQADTAVLAPEKVKGTMAWLIGKYRESKRYLKLADNTVASYKPWLRDLETTFGHIRVASFTRTEIVDYIEATPEGSQAVAATVLRNIFKLAYYYGLIPTNPAMGLEAEKGKSRNTVWSDKEFKNIISACKKHREADALVVGLHAMRYTGQRPSDALRLSLRDIQDNGRLEITQQKTGREISIPLHAKLKPYFEQAKMAGHIFIVTSTRRRPVPYVTFEGWFRKVRKSAGLEHLQMRDLRRTAVTELKLLGCSDEEVTAITGHSLSSFKTRMADVYTARDTEFADSAIRKWEGEGV